MGYGFDFDFTHKILRAYFTGTVTDAELKEYYEVARGYVQRTAPHGAVIDFCAVAEFQVSPETIRTLAETSPIMPNPREIRVIVAEKPAIFGLSRMFQFEGQHTRPSLHVVRTWREVTAILGVKEFRFEPIRGDVQSPRGIAGNAGGLKPDA